MPSREMMLKEIEALEQAVQTLDQTLTLVSGTLQALQILPPKEIIDLSTMLNMVTVRSTEFWANSVARLREVKTDEPDTTKALALVRLAQNILDNHQKLHGLVTEIRDSQPAPHDAKTRGLGIDIPYEEMMFSGTHHGARTDEQTVLRAVDDAIRMENTD